MIIPKRILEACARPGSEARPAFAHVYVHVEAGKGQAWATDGHIIVCMPVEVGQGECSALVPRRAIELADKGKGALKGMIRRTEEGTWLVPGAGVSVEPVQGNFPPREKLAHMMHKYGSRLLHVDLALLQRVGKLLKNMHVSIWGEVESGEPLYMENGDGVRVIVAPLRMEESVRKERRRLARMCAEEEVG